jgi:hypothetical protein
MPFLTDPFPTENATPGSTSPSTFAGGIVGGILAVAVLSAAAWFILRRRRRRQKRAGIEFLSPEQPAVAEMAAAPGQLYPDGRPGPVPPSHGQPGKYGPAAVAEADSFAYAEADGASRHAELPGTRMDRRSHAAELDGGGALRR